MMSFVVTKEKITVWICIIAMAALVAIYVFTYWENSFKNPETKYEIENTDPGRREFIESFGIKLKKDKCKKARIKIPEKFDKHFEEMEIIQKDMGLSFNNVKGLFVNKYTYNIENEENISYVELYVYDKYVVGALKINPDFNNGYITSLNAC